VLTLTESWSLTTVRHGETDCNKENRYAGTIDVPLNEAGRNDVSHAAPQIRSMKFDVAIVSPLRRATETAQILTEGLIEIIPSSYAQERNYGILQGCAYTDVEHIRPPIHFIKAGGDFHSLNPPEAETFEELRARSEAFYEYIISHFMGRNILVVSHGVFLQQFHGLLRGKDWIESLGTSVGNLELTTFRFKGKTVTSEERMYLAKRKQSNF
jgi:broad specificity phosphatase PhoE